MADYDEALGATNDSIARLLRGLTLPAALMVPAGAKTGDFLANTAANVMGMRRPNPAALSDSASRFTDPGFQAWKEIGDSMNPMPMLRSAAQSAGWQDVEPETPRTTPQARREIGVGGPAPSLSLPRLGARSPVVIDNNTGAVDSSAQGFGEEPRLENAGAFSSPAQGGVPAQSDDLGEQYRKGIAGIKPPTGDLTPEQRNKLSMDFYMRMLASNKGGSRFLQNAGQAGLATSDAYQGQMDRNLARNTQQQQFARDDVYKALGLTDKSQDNKELARHHKALEGLQNQQNEINKAYREGQITAKEAELEVRKIQAQMAELRAQAVRDRANPLEQQILTILKYGPKGQTNEEALRTALSKGKSDEDTQLDDLHKAMSVAAARSGMPAPSREQVRAGRLYGSQISRSHPDYIQTLKSMPGGDTRENRDKLDAVLKTSRGLRVVD